MSKITDEMRDKLKAPLPVEAISKHPSKTYLSSIKAIYVEERLNDVFGVGAWTTKVEKIDSAASVTDKNGNTPTMVVVKCTFEIPEFGVYHECYGGNDNADLGDAYKGATTDAISKIGSYLEIGMDVYKGKGGATSAPRQTAPQTGRYPAKLVEPSPEELSSLEF